MYRRLLLLLALIGLATPALAHFSPNSTIYLDFGDRSAAAELLIPRNELDYALGRKSDAELARWLMGHLRVAAPDGRPWTATLKESGTVTDQTGVDFRAVVRLLPPEHAPIRKFSVHYDGLIDRDSNHFVLVFARSDFASGALTASEPAMIGGLQGATRSVVVNRGPGSAWRGFTAAIGLGMHHIAEGHDHLLFLIALILPAPLLAAGRRWGDYGGLRHTTRRLVQVVTAFTIGHSMTLIGGAFFGWKLPQQPVEILIALSILVSAIHAWRPLFAGKEAFVAGGFGLIHGLAFATIIGNFGLEPLQKAQSILGFNLGIEIVQLLVVACVMPSLMMFAKTRFYPRMRTVGAAFAGIAAAAWLIERTLGTRNILAGAIDDGLGYAPWGIAALTLAAIIVTLVQRRSVVAAVA